MAAPSTGTGDFRDFHVWTVNFVATGVWFGAFFPLLQTGPMFSFFLLLSYSLDLLLSMEGKDLPTCKSSLGTTA